MAYHKLDVRFPLNMKVAALSDAAFRLHVTALCWATSHATDGVIPVSQVPFLMPRPKAMRFVSELVTAGLWEDCDGGWTIHDFLKHQRSKAQMESDTDAAKLRMQCSRSGKHRSSECFCSSDVRPNTTGPVRANTPDPARAKFNSRIERGEGRGERGEDQPTVDNPLDSTRARVAMDWYRELNHREPPNAVSREAVVNLDSHPGECLAWAFESAADKDDPWRYGKRILDSCLSEGHGPRRRAHGRADNARANQGGRAIRQGDGRHLGASQRVPGVGVDWDAEQRAVERTQAGAGGRTAGLPAGEVE